MKLDMSDHEAGALLWELDDIIDGDCYFLPPRIQTLKGAPPAKPLLFRM